MCARFGTTKDKNNLAADTRNALQYGENLVAQRRFPRYSRQCRKNLYLDENRETSHLRRQDIIGVEIEQKKAVEKSGRAFELCIYR